MGLSGVQVLNAAIEGMPLEYNAQRFLDLKDRVNFLGVVVHPGFHNLIYGNNSPKFWAQLFDVFRDVPVFAICNLAADLHPDCETRGYGEIIEERDVSDYLFWPGINFSPESIRNFAGHLEYFNNLIAEYCQFRGCLRIDMREILMPKSYEEVTTRFHDLIHPRASEYQAMGAVARQVLGPAVAGALVRANARKRVLTAPAGIPAAEVQSGSIYPLW